MEGSEGDPNSSREKTEQSVLKFGCNVFETKGPSTPSGRPAGSSCIKFVERTVAPRQGRTGRLLEEVDVNVSHTKENTLTLVLENLGWTFKYVCYTFLNTVFNRFLLENAHFVLTVDYRESPPTPPPRPLLTANQPQTSPPPSTTPEGGGDGASHPHRSLSRLNPRGTEKK